MEATIITAAKAAQRTAKTVSTASKAAGLLRTIRKKTTARALYRMELRMTRAILDFDDRHPSYSTALLWAEFLIGSYLIFMYA